uniref:Uncharacterized protein n=1 Tax=Rhizophora mucronata TaxID=61149 RepID=A0A2P2NX61_RHIMU
MYCPVSLPTLGNNVTCKVEISYSLPECSLRWWQ